MAKPNKNSLSRRRFAAHLLKELNLVVKPENIIPVRHRCEENRLYFRSEENADYCSIYTMTELSRVPLERKGREVYPKEERKI